MSHECRHNWIRVTDTQDRCNKCGSMQMTLGLAVDYRSKNRQKKPKPDKPVSPRIQKVLDSLHG